MIEEEEKKECKVSRRTSFDEFYQLEDEYGNKVDIENLNLCKTTKKRKMSAKSEKNDSKQPEIHLR
jgi:hypothetical protein